MVITVNGNTIDNWNKVEYEIEEIKLNYAPKLSLVDNFGTKILFASTAITSTDLTSLWDIINLFQDFAFYVALCYSLWGLIEHSMDNPGGMQKVKRCVTSYIGIFVIPVVFKAIKNALG